jgi:hypothetical protein
MSAFLKVPTRLAFEKTFKSTATSGSWRTRIWHKFQNWIVISGILLVIFQDTIIARMHPGKRRLLFDRYDAHTGEQVKIKHGEHKHIFKTKLLRLHIITTTHSLLDLCISSLSVVFLQSWVLNDRLKQGCKG